jgi:hypothetical protein
MRKRSCEKYFTAKKNKGLNMIFDPLPIGQQRVDQLILIGQYVPHFYSSIIIDYVIGKCRGVEAAEGTSVRWHNKRTSRYQVR